MPVVQHLNAPAYLFHREDGMEMVHAGALEGIGAVAASVLGQLDRTTREALDQGRYTLSEAEQAARAAKARAIEEAHGLRFRGFRSQP